MSETQPPLILCMDNAAGEEVSLSIEPNDDFHSFLIKANALLGYEVDLNSVTRNKPVALTDSIYKFFLNAENNPLDYPVGSQTFDQILEPNGDGTDDLVYVLDDGTQIKASQIHFDNEDPPFDFVAERIPFVKYIDDGNDDIETASNFTTKMVNIVASPVSKWSDKSSPRKPFINTVPFKLVSNNASVFAAQFNKYLESNIDKTFTPLNTVTAKNKSPRSLISDNYKKYEDNVYNKNDSYITRDEVLNLFKDPPVVPYETNQNINEKRRHVRKTDPSRPMHKAANTKPMPYIDDDGTLIGQNESQNCFICEKYVNNNMEKLYLFDNEDQKLHRSSPQKKLSTQLKIICEECLDNNFRPSRMKSPSINLNPDEYLVIRNNQQYIFQKTNSIDFKNIRAGFVNISEATAIIDKIETEILKGNQVKQMDFVKVEIGSDGEIKTEDIEKEKKDGSSDVEIVEGPDIDDVIDNLEEADEEVKEFLGMYQCDDNAAVGELKCRFCERIFEDLSQLMEHGDVHKHVMDDGEVYPCPLCNYGYANFKWLKGHLRAAHDKSLKLKVDGKGEETQNDSQTESTSKHSPVAKRTRSNDNKDKELNDDSVKSGEEKSAEASEPANVDDQTTMLIKLEVKQEALDTSDEEAIWIVHTADDAAANQLQTLLGGSEKTEDAVFKKPQKCDNCSQIMVDQSTHKCRKRGRKRKCSTKDDNVTFAVPQKDFLKRAQGKPKQSTDTGNNNLLVAKARKKRTALTSDPQIVTCHNCNESYTSKVRLKFHMQFHETTPLLDANGQYRCHECDGTTFATETELFDHVHFQHDKQNRYQCPVKGCGKTFFLRASLTKHSRIHTDTRRYVCGTCGKRFLDKQTLDEHGVTHLQIKPFQCHICLKQLTRRSRLRMHMRAHEEALCPALVPVCAACRRAFPHTTQAVEHVMKTQECLETFRNTLKENDRPTAVLSPTSGLVRPTQLEETTGIPGRIEREAKCAGSITLLASVPAELKGAVRAVQVEKAFRCEYCEDVFYLEEDLNNHRVIHKGIKNPFTCHICKVSFATYSRCTTHKTTHGFYKRPLADAKKDQPNQGDAGHSARGILGYGGFPVVKHFLCEDCGRSYLHWTYLQVHRRMKHANENFIYKCMHCDETFPNSWSVAYHRKKVHGTSTSTSTGKGNGAAKTVNNDYRIPCRDCDEILPNKTALYKHRKKEHSFVTLEGNNKHGYSCHVCGTWFATPAARDSHARAHGSRAACPRCGDSFPHHQALYTHLKQVHGQDLPFSCPSCASRFATAAELAQHAAGAGHAQRPHACAVCGHGFRTASMRAEHARIHTDERPFACDVCGVAFRRLTAMRNHRLIHTGVRAWGCTRCPKRFRIRSDLNTHARLKHPLRLAAIEMQGLNPGPDEVLQCLAANNISRESVVEITKISFPKGSTGVIPDSYRALSRLSGAQRTEVPWSFASPVQPVTAEGQAARRGRGIARGTRRLAIIRSPDTDHHTQDLGGLNVQMLLQDNSTHDLLQHQMPLDPMSMLNTQRSG